jgi:hypothetical protein
VGVHHQYCGQLGKQANCQAAVTLSIANHHASLPIAHQLYLPKVWAGDAARRRKAHVPKTVRTPVARHEHERDIAARQRRRDLARRLAAQIGIKDHPIKCWGARLKVERLEDEFAELLCAQAAEGTGVQSGAAVGVDSSELDIASVMKASRAISSEVVLEQLWATTMRIMLENAGGQRGCFVVRKDGQLVIEGVSEVGCDAEDPPRSIPVDGAEGALALPISIVYHVMHTNRPVVLQDAARAGPYARDTYLLRRSTPWTESFSCTAANRAGSRIGSGSPEKSRRGRPRRRRRTGCGADTRERRPRTRRRRR